MSTYRRRIKSWKDHQDLRHLLHETAYAYNQADYKLGDICEQRNLDPIAHTALALNILAKKKPLRYKFSPVTEDVSINAAMKLKRLNEVARKLVHEYGFDYFFIQNEVRLILESK